MSDTTLNQFAPKTNISMYFGEKHDKDLPKTEETIACIWAKTAFFMISESYYALM